MTEIYGQGRTHIHIERCGRDVPENRISRSSHVPPSISALGGRIYQQRLREIARINTEGLNDLGKISKIDDYTQL